MAERASQGFPEGDYRNNLRHRGWVEVRKSLNRETGAIATDYWHPEGRWTPWHTQAQNWGRTEEGRAAAEKIRRQMTAEGHLCATALLTTADARTAQEKEQDERREERQARRGGKGVDLNDLTGGIGRDMP